MKSLIKAIDKANGYLYSTSDYSGQSLSELILPPDESDYFR